MSISLANQPLSVKGVIVVALPVCALLSTMALLFEFERQSRTAEESVLHSFDVRMETRLVLTAALNAETGLRGYLLTRRESFLEPYDAARTELNQHLANLRTLVANDPAEAMRAGQIDALAGGLLAFMEDLREDAASGGAAIGRLERGKAEMDKLRAELGAMLDLSRRRFALRARSAAAARQRLEAGVFAGGALGLLGGIVAALVFARGIGRRVSLLEDDARCVAQGLRVEGAITGKDEIGRLGHTLRATGQTIARQREEIQRAHDELELRVAQRTVELLTANEQLRQANELSQAVIGSTPLAMWAIDLEGNVTFWNPAAERIFGWAEAELIGRPAAIIPPDQQEEFPQWLDRFRNGERLVAMERKRQHKNGSLIDVAIWTAPLRDANGAITGTVMIASDITGRKILEEQFRQSQKLEAVGRLAGGVAHDFNNLLTVIMGYVEMLLTEAKDPDLIDYACEIAQAATRANGLTAQLLAFSRRQTSQPRILDLNEVVKQSTRLLSRVIGEDIEIVTHLDDTLGRVKADPIHVDQMIMNLVVNARDAMPGGGKLTIETANVVLDENSMGHMGVGPGPFCLLAVGDTGVGMTPEIKSRLFEPFFTTKEAGKGTGLGLSIVYGIVKQNNGEITVYSEPGIGTTFKIYLPMAEGPVEFSAPEPSLTGLRGTESVLLCEDEAVIRRLVRSMLERQGYTVIEAETPRKAMEIARDQRWTIDLLLTDVVMPETSGVELAKFVQQVRPEIKVLYMSGYTDNRISGSWELDRSIAFLQKPFTAATLARKIRETLAV